ncbi:hypothetical protein STIAU_2323, partial [Stigmatella aurantiaca DW4/3-1]
AACRSVSVRIPPTHAGLRWWPGMAPRGPRCREAAHHLGPALELPHFSPRATPRVFWQTTRVATFLSVIAVVPSWPQ